MRGSVALILAGLLLAVGGCKKEAQEGVAGISSGGEDFRAANVKGAIMPPGSAAAPAKPAAPAPAKPVPPPRPRKLVRTVDLRLEVKDSAAVARQIETLITRMGGYVSASNAQRQGELLTYTLTVRVPVDRYDQALAGIRGYAVRSG